MKIYKSRELRPDVNKWKYTPQMIKVNSIHKSKDFLVINILSEKYKYLQVSFSSLLTDKNYDVITFEDEDSGEFCNLLIEKSKNNFYYETQAIPLKHEYDIVFYSYNKKEMKKQSIDLYSLELSKYQGEKDKIIKIKN